MNWNNLEKSLCPSCNHRLQFRVAGTRNNIRSRNGGRFDDDFYFCFPCDFQISATKRYLLLKKLKKPLKNLSNGFDGGYLSM